MPNITIDNETYQLVDISPDVFREFAQMARTQLPALFQLPRDRRFIGQIPAGFILDRQINGGEFTEPLVQAAMWNLHDLGVEELLLLPQEKSVNIVKSSPTDCALGKASWINFTTVTSGRAFIAAMNNVVHRIFRLNDQEVEVELQSAENLRETINKITEIRKENEAPILTISRLIGSLIKSDVGMDRPEMKCAIELASGAGIVAMSVDIENEQISFHQFSEMAAMSSALLQGATWEQILAIRNQMQAMVGQASGAGVSQAPPSYSPSSVKRRRRN